MKNQKYLTKKSNLFAKFILNVAIVLFVITLSSSFIGCGQKGELVLPDKSIAKEKKKSGLN